ncbi:hypothetical protein B2G71_14335 [Novosphingobium sp. PC22D]|uniref:nuclear transport factor 2 family protein n=1 Tax=Novosphingobium sp. PC22D TaxID=1962403 RepID=UPI000BEF8B14|nr:nuclear transport factor 2 family protein [Novosphingobium sp. PC22D]PEQ11955.1 hypothetical protein B2G71_14335 [Novosphingobium sp. PC22D]
MDDIERLAAIEAIKQVKARYFYGLDNKDWDYWAREVWAPEGRLEVAGLEAAVAPRDVMIPWVARQMADCVSIHHGHTPIIDFVSDVEARVIWAMEDRLYKGADDLLQPGCSQIHGWGHYHETYVRLDCGWRLRSSKLTRLRTERVFVS